MTDQLLHLLCGDGNIRISAIDGTELVRTAQEIHGLSRVATAALGRQFMMTVIMGSMLKNADERVSTIVKGDGPAGSLVCTADPACHVKGCIGASDIELPLTEAGKLDVAGLVGRTGKLTVVRDLSMKEPYVGTCNLISGEIAMDFAQYFTVSEQQPSLVYLGVHVDAADGRVRAAGGLLLQPMPGCPDSLIDEMQSLSSEISNLTSRLDAQEQLESVVTALFSAYTPEVSERLSPEYRCDCSRARIERALISVGEKDLTEMRDQDHGAEITCQFCNKRYQFTADDLGQLIQEASKQ